MSDEIFDAWMPIYWGDYLADTMDFSTAEHGAYLLLIAHYWRTKKPIPNDIRTLQQITKLRNKGSVRTLYRVVTKFQDDGHTLTHKRIEEEIRRATHIRSSYAERGKKGAEARWNGHSSANSPAILESMAGPMLGRCPPQPQPQPHKTTSKKSPLPPLKIDLPDELERAGLRPVIESWFSYKKERGETYKKSGMSALLKKLVTWTPEDITAAINDSMANNWAGLFKPKIYAGNGGQPKMTRGDISNQIIRDNLERLEREERERETNNRAALHLPGILADVPAKRG